MHDYMAAVCVVLAEPAIVTVAPRPALILTEVSPSAAAYDGGEMRAIGYHRNIALRAEPDHVKHVLMSYIDDGDIHWGETGWHEMAEHDIPEHAAEGVWFAGGRSYFSEWS
jgi:hypothetical protein